MSDIAKKLQKIQENLKAPKNQRNDFGRYNYRSCEDILEAVKPLLAAQGCALRLYDEPVFLGDWHYIKATAELFDGEGTVSTTAYARESVAKKGMDDSQITGAASSYARKYALNGLFCIDDTKDADTPAYASASEMAKKAKAAGLPVQQVPDSPPPAALCKQCGKPIVDAKIKDGRIMPAKVILQKWGGLCADCVKQNAEAKKKG